MKIISTKFSGLKVIKSKIFKDTRGFFKEDFKKKFFREKKFIFGCTSSSKKNVLRGLHLQTKFSQAKYLSILKGSILDVVVDLRKNSKTFGKYYSCILSESNSKSVYIPPGFAHGFLTLGKENYVLYSCTQYRNSKFEKSIRFDDKNLKIKWPTVNPIISNKDKKAMSFTEYKNKNL